MIDVKDHSLTCDKCGQTFVFTAAEAQAFADKGLKNLPKKCAACRSADRTKRDRKIRQTVACAACGTSFEVPFEPALDPQGQPQRPLYCIEHFEQAGQASA